MSRNKLGEQQMISGDVINKILSAPVKLDNYLLDVAMRTATHAFLGNATQGCYIRMIKLLTLLYTQQGRDLSTVRVLDWGTGKGHISYLLKAAGFNVTSCDVRSSAEDNSFSQKTPILEEKLINVISLDDPWILPFKDGEFDLVVSFGVLEHVSNDYESLREIRRVLTCGGMFFFSFLPYWFSWIQRLSHLRGNLYHHRLYKKKTLVHMAENAGFKVVHIWHGQLLPKNAAPHNNVIENVDRFLTHSTPLKYFATNLEGIFIAE